jgi:long-chain acyl-CoA synthetase
MTFTALDVHNKITELSAPGTPFEMKDFTIAGEARRGFAAAPTDLVQLLQAGRGHGDKPFVIYEDQRLSFDEYAQLPTVVYRVCGHRFLRGYCCAFEQLGQNRRAGLRS